jgi:hypothetical protein
MKSDTSTDSSAFSHNINSSDTKSSSTVATLVASKSDSDSLTSVKNTSVIKNVQGAVTLDDAAATNIAVDGSTINTTTTYAVTLAGTAEENAKALNIVNAAGGLVANGLNIAHSTNINAIPTLTQTNSISQVK